MLIGILLGLILTSLFIYFCNIGKTVASGTVRIVCLFIFVPALLGLIGLLMVGS